MKNSLMVCLLILTACGGTLTEEQRKKVKQDMQDHAIKKVNEAQITEAAFIMGRDISRILEMEKFSVTDLDSLQQTYHVKVISLKPGDGMEGVEQQIIDAYIEGSGRAELNDNVQRLGTDSILYTKPIMKELPDGSLQFNYAIGVRMAKKSIVLSIQ